MRKFGLFLLAAASPASAIDQVEVARKDGATVSLSWADSDPVDIFTSDTPGLAKGAKPVIKASRAGTASLDIPANKRRYIILRDGGDKSLVVAAEREVPLEKGSNFRDLGGYKGAGGKPVRWGRIFRSGALPMLTEADYALLGQLNIRSIIDLRSLDERQVAPTQLDDRTGALFIANDYSMKPLMANYGKGDGEFAYRGMGQMLAPQYRAIFRRLLADDGAVMYNCSAGQDRTGIASALILSALGVDRQTILADYHLSTKLRRPQNEMPDVNPADFPGNFIVQYYAAARKTGTPKAEPLYSPKGNAHLAQFFELVDKDYGGVEGYLSKELGITSADVLRLRALYLQ